MDLFGALIFAIIGQQISVIAAMAIFARLTERFGARVPNASELVTLDPETLRGIGLSRRKAATVLDLAQRFSDGRLSAAELGKLPDQDVIGQLTAVKGIGPGPCRARCSSPTAYLEITRQWGDVIRVVIDVAPHDDECAAVLATARRRHNRNLTDICRHLEGIGALRDGVDARLACRIITYYYGLDGLLRTRDVFGWSLERSNEWLQAHASAAVLR
jgi:hypothetical protein